MLTDADLEAIAARLAQPWYADAVVRTRDDAVALLAEVRRLRGPLDVAGLMTAEMLAGLGALRDRLAAGVVSASAVAGRLRDLEQLRTSLPGILAHLDAQAALARAQYGLISDLLSHGDGPGVPAYERGKAEGREEAAAVAQDYGVEGSEGVSAGEFERRYGTGSFFSAVRFLGPRRPPRCRRAKRRRRRNECGGRCGNAWTPSTRSSLPPRLTAPRTSTNGPDRLPPPPARPWARTPAGECRGDAELVAGRPRED